MAEFAEVIRQKARLCNASPCCIDCPVGEDSTKIKENILCSVFECKYPELFEEIVMKWAAEHPELKYPTWVDWWNENFGGEGRQMLRPCSFVPPRELGCSIGHDGCMQAPYKCWHTPIPAHIAEKLGIKPIEEE